MRLREGTYVDVECVDMHGYDDTDRGTNHDTNDDTDEDTNDDADDDTDDGGRGNRHTIGCIFRRAHNYKHHLYHHRYHHRS